jgi:glucose/arabinose dehydrogenase
MRRLLIPLLLLAALTLAACQSATPTPAATVPVETLAPTATLPSATEMPPATRPPATGAAATPEPETTATPAPTATPVPVTFPPRVAIEPFTALSEEITYLTHAGDGSGRIFLVSKAGRIWVVEDGDIRRTPFLDISDIVDSAQSERGLLSVAFDPDFANNGEFYVNFSSKQGDGDTVIARYRTEDFQAADPATGVEILRIDQPAANHNGGQLKFGPDGFL